MSSNDHSKDSDSKAADLGFDPQFEMHLAREVKKLDVEMIPTRNLWAGIERNMLDHPQKPARRLSQNWMPSGIALSLCIAMASLWFSLTGSDQITPFAASDQAVYSLQNGYRQVRNPLVDQFNKTNKALSQETLEDIYRNIEIMAEARREIEQQVRLDPGNQKLMSMLMRLHEREIELLRADYSVEGRTL